MSGASPEKKDFIGKIPTVPSETHVEFNGEMIPKEVAQYRNDCARIKDKFEQIKLLTLIQTVIELEREPEEGFEENPFYAKDGLIKFHKKSGYNPLSRKDGKFEDIKVEKIEKTIEFLNNQFREIGYNLPSLERKRQELNDELLEFVRPEHKKPSKEKKDKPPIFNPFITPGKSFHLKTPDQLKNLKIGEYYSTLFGLKKGQNIPETLDINFTKIIQTAWDIKSQRDDAHNFRINNYLANKQGSFFKYCAGKEDPGKTDIKGYKKDIKTSIDEIKKDIQREKITINGSTLKPEEIQLLKQIASTINEEDLLSYSFTELLPMSDNKGLNTILFEFFLQNAGKKFIENFPAIHDGVLSFGPYQHTANVICQKKVKNKEGKFTDSFGGATEIDQAMPEKQRLPVKLEQIAGNQHHKAAYLFMIYNLGFGLLKLRDQSSGAKSLLQIFSEYIKSPNFQKENIVKYIALAHHNPKGAQQGLVKWLQDNCKNKFENYVKDKAHIEYIKKTGLNLKELKQYAQL